MTRVSTLRSPPRRSRENELSSQPSRSHNSLVMVSNRDDVELPFVNIVDDSVLRIDSARPRTAQSPLERFRLADALAVTLLATILQSEVMQLFSLCCVWVTRIVGRKQS